MDHHPEVPARDLLGKPLDADEQAVADLYLRTRDLCRRSDLAPCVRANLAQSQVLLWNACCDLNLLYEEPEPDRPGPSTR